MKRPIQAQPWKRRAPIVAKPGSTIDPALRAAVRAREGGCCALCRAPLGQVWECHHRLLRSQGGQDSVCNLIALDSHCHRRVHGHRAWARDHGFIVHATADPATAPVAVGLTSWQLLTPDGRYVPVPDTGDAA